MSTRLVLPNSDQEDAASGICDTSSRLANFFSEILLAITPAFDFKIVAFHNLRGLDAELCENVSQSVSINEGSYLRSNYNIASKRRREQIPALEGLRFPEGTCGSWKR
jgi:hypothetical protein